MCCPIMSVTFGKVLYPIPQKMPLKRYVKFRAYHAYICLDLFFKNFNVLITQKRFKQKWVSYH